MDGAPTGRHRPDDIGLVVVPNHPGLLGSPPDPGEGTVVTRPGRLEMAQFIAGPDRLDVSADARIRHLDVLHLLEAVGEDVERVAPPLQFGQNLQSPIEEVPLVRTGPKGT